MPDNPARPPRFPYVAALLCAACLGAAAWTWMRYSYAWGVRPDDLIPGERSWPTYEVVFRREGSARRVAWVRARVEPPGATPKDLFGRKYRLLGRYVRLRVPCSEADWQSYIRDPLGNKNVFRGEMREDAPVVRGRAIELVPPMMMLWKVPIGWRLAVDLTASRFHGGSIAGLVVGAMGVFVFAVALRHWLGERRSVRERSEGA